MPTGSCKGFEVSWKTWSTVPQKTYPYFARLRPSFLTVTISGVHLCCWLGASHLPRGLLTSWGSLAEQDKQPVAVKLEKVSICF